MGTSNRWTYVLPGLACLVFAAACDAPRDNPYDPASPHYHKPDPPSRIENLAYDSLSATRCRMFWSAPLRAVQYRLYSGLPDWDGGSLSAASRYTGELPAVREPGQMQSVWITLPASQTRAWAMFSLSADSLLSPASNILIIAAPRYDRPASVSLTSHSQFVASWTGDDKVSLVIEAAINDSDGVELVWVRHLENDSTLGLLAEQGDESHWGASFAESNLPGGSVEALVGHQLGLYHLDNAGFRTLDTTFSVLRVINLPPAVIFPLLDDTVGTQEQTFVWDRYKSGFQFTYSMSIYRVPSNPPITPVKVYEKSNIPFTNNSHTLDSLLVGEPLFWHYWTTTVTDEFGNESVSLDTRFWIADDE